MTTFKGEALVTLRIPFEYDVDEAEFAEWADKPLSEATAAEVMKFMESGWEPWEYDATWADALNTLNAFEVYETVLDDVWKDTV